MKLNNQKAYYTNEIEKVKEERKELFSSWENLEKFGREKYHMKRDSEDIYLIVEEKKQRKADF